MNLRQRTFAIFAGAALVGAAFSFGLRLISVSPAFSTALSLTLLGCLAAALFRCQLHLVSRIRKLLGEAKTLVERNAFAEPLRMNGIDEFSALASCVNTASVQAEKAQTRFQLLTENLQQIFWIQDAKTGAFKCVSLAFETIWGPPRTTIAQNSASWLELHHPEDREGAQRKKLAPFDLDYLREAGALDLLPNWRKLAAAALSSAGVLVH